MAAGFFTRRRLALLISLFIGVVTGLGGYTFVYARGWSYLTNDPAACANCHVMEDHFRAWTKSSHRAVATCNDCHTPHGFAAKYAVKAKNGFWHSYYFTTGQYPDPIRITEPNHDVVEQACRSCHTPIVEAIDHGVPYARAGDDAKQALSCTRCHRHVGHWLR